MDELTCSDLEGTFPASSATGGSKSGSFQTTNLHITTNHTATWVEALDTGVYPKVSGMTAWGENYKW
jgi:hypothetical protein